MLPILPKTSFWRFLFSGSFVTPRRLTGWQGPAPLPAVAFRGVSVSESFLCGWDTPAFRPFLTMPGNYGMI